MHFRGIPYAEAGRFEPARAVAAWSGIRDATQHGPISPQLQSPITRVMGTPSAAPQDEACLTLSVSTPVASAKPRAVMAWLHGGAYVVGASSYEWYRPDLLVREGDVVVVSVNYRVGLFGYLYSPGLSPGNLGLLDQLAALRWIQTNIAAFGGDPTNVTVFGESAGGHSIAAMLACPEAKGLFRRAIVQSPHLGLGFVNLTRAQLVATTLTNSLQGLNIKTSPAHDLLDAQRRMQITMLGPAGLNSAPAFGPVAGVAPLPAPAQTDPCRAILHRDVDLIIGSTREEMRAYFDLNPRITALRELPWLGQRAYARLVQTITDRVFTRPVQRFADAHAASGRANVYLYRFEWSPVPAPYGCCHTLDLPFTFGAAGWPGSPMLGNTPSERIDALGRELRSAWTSFARVGNPNATGTPHWRRHVPGASPARRFFSDPTP